MNGLPILLLFPAYPAGITPVATFANVPTAG